MLGIFQEGSEDHPPLGIRYVGGEHLYRTDAGGLPQQGGPLDDRQETLEATQWNMGVPPFGVCVCVCVRYRDRRGGGVHHLETEYGCAVH